MANKIFVSYRREDSAANALGISQYLEREFGSRNVFIDIDMRAGAKFPVVLAQRLKECAVMLVLIGPHWLDVRDPDGNRRLDNPDDWVRLELGMALKRGITVIPVLVGGANLPSKAALPDDIKGLLDHQSASIGNASFRSDMAGLVRDIRPERSNKRIWTGAALAGAAAVVLGLLVFGASMDWMTRPSSDPKSPSSSAGKTDAASVAKPAADVDGPDMKGWTLYDYVPATKTPHFMKLDTVRVFSDRVAVERRSLKETGSDPQHPEAYYDQGILVFDCKNSMLATAEIAHYSKSGKLLQQFTWGDPQNLERSLYAAVVPGSIGDSGHHFMCNSELRNPLVAAPLDAAARRMTGLTKMSGGEGEIFYDQSVSRALDGSLLVTFLTRLFKDTSTTRLFPSIHPSMPAAYRFSTQRARVNCKENRATFLKSEAYNSASELIWIRAVKLPAAETILENSPMGLLKPNLCK